MNNKLNEQLDFIQKLTSEIQNTRSGLSNILTPELVFLPTGYSNKIATEKHSKITATQLRKFYDMLKTAEMEEKFENKRNAIYRILPQMAYAAGRNNLDRNFYKLMCACINQEKLNNDNDIKVLIDFYESIIAYSKK